MTRPVILLAISVLITDSAMAAEADYVSAQASLQTYLTWPTPQIIDTQTDIHYGSTTASAMIFSDGLSRAGADAALGTLKVFTVAATVIPLNHYNATADAYSSDNVQFLYRATRLTQGIRPYQVRLSFSVSGLLYFGGSGTGLNGSVSELEWNSSLRNEASNPVAGSSGSYAHYTDGNAHKIEGTEPGVFSYSVPYSTVEGRTLTLFNDLVCGSNGGGGVCYANHSFEWGGAELLDANGRAMEGLEVVSGSGFDYTRPTAGYLAAIAAVPETSSWVMLMAGLAAVGATSRKHRAKASTRQRASS